MTSASVRNGTGSWRPLLVAGVAGGVGTSTWVRILQAVSRLPVRDLGQYGGGMVDVLVTSNTASAAARVGSVLARCPLPPVLVVMHTVPGVVVESRSLLRKVQPHVAARLDVAHYRSWVEMEHPPGPRLLPVRAKDLAEVLRQFPAALQAMYSPADERSAVTGSAGQGARAVPVGVGGAVFGPAPVTRHGP